MALDIGYVTPSDFEFFKERQAEFIESGLFASDKRMRDIIRRFSLLPHIATVWSCSSHTLEERKLYSAELSEAEIEGMVYDERSHVVFVMEKGGEWILDAFNTFQSEMDMKTWDYCRPQLNLIQLLFPGQCVYPRRYSCWEIEITTDVNHDSEKKVCQLIWKLLVDILEDHTLK